jgi:hypothetical protein
VHGVRLLRILPIFLPVFAVVVPAQDLSPIRNEIDMLAESNFAGLGEEQTESLIGDLADSVVRVKLLDGIDTEGSKIVQQILAFRRADVRSSSSSAASGSTSAVLNPLLPAIFGISFESGAITRSVSGSTIVLKANPAGLVCTSGSNPQPVALRDGDACRTFWKRFGITAAFDTSRGDKKTELDDLQTLDNQFSEFNVHVELLNHRTLSGRKFNRVFKEEINDWLATASKFVNISAEAAIGDFEERLREDIAGRLIQLVRTKSFVDAGEKARTRRIEDAILRSLDAVPGDLKNAKERRRLWLDSLKSNARLQSAVLNALVVAAEYGYQRPDLATKAIGDIVPAGIRPPDVHSVRLLAAKGIGARRLDITANASASFFSETRPGMNSVFRDFRIGFESKFRTRDVRNWGVPTLSFAGLYVYLNQEPLGLGLAASNRAEIAEKGHIGLFQAKFEMPTANNAVRIPISFTYSNRTELIRESDTRGQIGISFNLDSLFNK